MYKYKPSGEKPSSWISLQIGKLEVMVFFIATK